MLDAYKDEVNRINVEGNRAIGRVNDPDLPPTGYSKDFRKRPDILDHRLLDVYDVKPEEQILLGYRQVNKYVQILARRYPGRIYKPGNWQPRHFFYTVERINGLINLPFKIHVIAWNAGNGVIAYDAPARHAIVALVISAMWIAEGIRLRNAATQLNIALGGGRPGLVGALALV
jgi:hypothetical protein